MSKWKCGICNSEFDNYQAQGFNGTIYCPLCYFKELYKREKTKNDKAIKYIKEKQKLNYMFGTITLSKDSQNELLEILGDKEIEEIPLFEGTLGQLNNLSILGDKE